MLPDGATERWSYDAEGNLAEYVDAAGQATRTEVTHFDLPSAQTGPDGARLEFGYDTELRLVSVTNPQGLVWRYEYNPAGNLVRETDFNGRVLAYTHDAAGQLIERVNGAGQVVRFSRDPLGNVVEKRSGDSVTTYAYDLVGRLARAVNGDADLRIERDTLGRVMGEICNDRALSSTYDATGQCVRRRTPSGAESHWAYDAAGLPMNLETGGQVITFEHDAAGREVRRGIGPGAVLAQQWDAAHRLIAQSLWDIPAPSPETSRSRLLQHRTYAYRPDGNLVGIGDRLSGDRQFDLDVAGRVTAVQARGWTERYAYDSVGNVTQAMWPAPQTEPSADAIGAREYTGTLIRRAGNIRYEYDAQGRVVLRQHARLSSKPLTWRYEWDAEDRLVEARTPNGQRWRYGYDPLGRRIAKYRLAPDGANAVERVDFTWDGLVLAEQVHTVWSTQQRAYTGRCTVWEYEPGRSRPLVQIEPCSSPMLRSSGSTSGSTPS